MIKKLSLFLLFTGFAWAADYQVCGKNSQTKVVACSPQKFTKEDAEVYAGAWNAYNADNGSPFVKFYVRKYSDKDVTKGPADLYPKVTPQPAVTPEPDQKAHV